MMLKEPKPRLPRNCTLCEQRFTPYGKCNRICDECKEDIKKRTIRKRKENLKKE